MTTREALRDQTSTQANPPPTGGGVASALAPVVTALVGRDSRVQFRFWDGSTLGPDEPVGVVRLHSPDALRRILWAPGELGLSRAYVAGDLSIQGDVFDVLAALRETSPGDLRKVEPRTLLATLRAARRLGAVGAPLPTPPEESHPAGRIHSQARDARAISHHYDVGNDFYELVLGPSWTYSCARFVTPASTLEEAQAAKYELICRKLGLDTHRGARLLDVGCGWGSMALHAARHHDARVVGVALSHEQVDKANQRVREAGTGGPDRDPLPGLPRPAGRAVRRHLVDRDVRARGLRAAPPSTSPRSATCSTRPDGCSTTPSPPPAGPDSGRRTFIGRYVFPDGELIDVGEVVLAMERAGFEVRDVESLREHYARTLRCWVANLEAHWDEAVALVGRPRADIWRLYMAGSALGFEDGGIAVHQVLGVLPDADGTSGMPRTREWD